jgi:hypothetical protein
LTNNQPWIKKELCENNLKISMKKNFTSLMWFHYLHWWVCQSRPSWGLLRYLTKTIF